MNLLHRPCSQKGAARAAVPAGYTAPLAALILIPNHCFIPHYFTFKSGELPLTLRLLIRFSWHVFLWVTEHHSWLISALRQPDLTKRFLRSAMVCSVVCNTLHGVEDAWASTLIEINRNAAETTKHQRSEPQLHAKWWLLHSGHGEPSRMMTKSSEDDSKPHLMLKKPEHTYLGEKLWHLKKGKPIFNVIKSS